MLDERQLKGIHVPVVTPFLPDGSGLDSVSFRTYVRSLMEQPIDGIVINGTTGESPTVTSEEVEAMFHITREERKDPNIAIILGTGTNNTASTVAKTEWAGKLGADAVLIVVPYYSRPSQEGIYQHFRRAAECGVPVIAYDIPGRSGVGLTLETAKRILELDGVIGLKDCSGGTKLVTGLASTGKAVLCGEDGAFLEMLAAGAAGGILASASVKTGEFAAIYRLAREGRTGEAEQRFSALQPMIKLFFRETNPTPLKWILAHQGVLASDAVRLPLVGITEALQAELAALEL
ncbi:4-hydroxy-tetrahydrodipicolinate synthase [Gorillibacterium sp. sgz5001074]|uniref:4-hydroxy-tetrahydrodipicolinate synthase n=1 Tax=Gorillibacterium sp. sgz5001074 TaxID=3446695 RepID=UPI003F67612E